MAVRLITPTRFQDSRGWFSETWNKQRLAALGIETDFVQDNQSFSMAAGTIRGLHFQHAPHAQAKLVRCVRGRIYDVAVDIRQGSPTFRQWVGAELSAETGGQLFIPQGFAHGFLTLEPDCEVAYKVDSFYAADAEGGIAWDDPDIAIAWPLNGFDPILSDKDASLPRLGSAESSFAYDDNVLGPLVPLS